MLPICPHCAGRDAYEIERAKFVCPCGHDYELADCLLPFSATVQFAKVFTHPLRIEILLQYGRKPVMSASDLSQILDEPLGNVSYHVSKLREAKPSPMLTVVKREPRRGAIETYLRVNPQLVGALA